MTDSEVIRYIDQIIDESKITNSAKISVTWDSFGIAVDLNYSYDEVQGYGEGVLCFCEPYDDGSPDPESWEEAQGIGQLLKDKYNLPLDITKDKAFLEALASKRSSLDSQISSASTRAAESQSTNKTAVKESTPER